MTVDYEKISNALHDDNNEEEEKFVKALAALTGACVCDLEKAIQEKTEGRALADEIRDFIDSKGLTTCSIQETNGVWIVIARSDIEKEDNDNE